MTPPVSILLAQETWKLFFKIIFSIQKHGLKGEVENEKDLIDLNMP